MLGWLIKCYVTLARLAALVNYLLRLKTLAKEMLYIGTHLHY